jgi:hypothetical protein
MQAAGLDQGFFQSAADYRSMRVYDAAKGELT